MCICTHTHIYTMQPIVIFIFSVVIIVRDANDFIALWVCGFNKTKITTISLQNGKSAVCECMWSVCVNVIFQTMSI